MFKQVIRTGICLPFSHFQVRGFLNVGQQGRKRKNKYFNTSLSIVVINFSAHLFRYQSRIGKTGGHGCWRRLDRKGTSLDARSSWPPLAASITQLSPYLSQACMSAPFSWRNFTMSGSLQYLRPPYVLSLMPKSAPSLTRCLHLVIMLVDVITWATNIF